jgi:ankyrin repeat protein
MSRRITIVDLASLGQVEELKKHIENWPSSVHDKTDLGCSAVFAAVNRNDLDMVTILANAGASLTDADALGRTPHSIASRRGYEEIAKFIESRAKL